MIAAKQKTPLIRADYRNGSNIGNGILKVRCGHVRFRTTYDTYEDGSPIQYDIEIVASYVRTGLDIQFTHFRVARILGNEQEDIFCLLAGFVLIQQNQNVKVLAWEALKKKLDDFEEDPVWLVPPKIDKDEVSHPRFTRGT